MAGMKLSVAVLVALGSASANTLDGSTFLERMHMERFPQAPVPENMPERMDMISNELQRVRQASVHRVQDRPTGLRARTAMKQGHRSLDGVSTQSMFTKDQVDTMLDMSYAVGCSYDVDSSYSYGNFFCGDEACTATAATYWYELGAFSMDYDLLESTLAYTCCDDVCESEYCEDSYKGILASSGYTVAEADATVDYMCACDTGSYSYSYSMNMFDSMCDSEACKEAVTNYLYVLDALDWTWSFSFNWDDGSYGYYGGSYGSYWADDDWMSSYYGGLYGYYGASYGYYGGSYGYGSYGNFWSFSYDNNFGSYSYDDYDIYEAYTTVICCEQQYYSLSYSMDQAVCNDASCLDAYATLTSGLWGIPYDYLMAYQNTTCECGEFLAEDLCCDAGCGGAIDTLGMYEPQLVAETNFECECQLSYSFSFDAIAACASDSCYDAAMALFSFSYSFSMDIDCDGVDTSIVDEVGVTCPSSAPMEDDMEDDNGSGAMDDEEIITIAAPVAAGVVLIGGALFAFMSMQHRATPKQHDRSIAVPAAAAGSSGYTEVEGVLSPVVQMSTY